MTKVSNEEILRVLYVVEDAMYHVHNNCKLKDFSIVCAPLPGAMQELSYLIRTLRDTGDNCN